VGIEGEGVIFHQPVTTTGKAGAPLHIEDQFFGATFPVVYRGVTKLMAFDTGADGIETVACSTTKVE
jgi:hypothetical protein